jgi:flagella basal body P-ring formation protein FlgA
VALKTIDRIGLLFVFCLVFLNFIGAGACLAGSSALTPLTDFLSAEIFKSAARLEGSRLKFDFILPSQKEDLENFCKDRPGLRFTLRKKISAWPLSQQIIPLTVTSGADKKDLDLFLKVSAWKKVLKSGQYIKKGTVFSSGQLLASEADLSVLPENVFFDEKEVLGQEAAFSIPAGRILTGPMVRPIPEIRAGRELTLLVYSGSILLKIPAVALEDGFLGRPVLVVNPRNRKRITARAVSPDVVELKI